MSHYLPLPSIPERWPVYSTSLMSYSFIERLPSRLSHGLLMCSIARFSVTIRESPRQAKYPTRGSFRLFSCFLWGEAPRTKSHVFNLLSLVPCFVACNGMF